LEVLEAAPNARLITNFLMLGKLSAEMQIPPDRVLLVNPGQTFSAGDRRFVAVRPPVFDSPASNGCFDENTGTLFAADAFGAFIPHHVEDVAEIPVETLAIGFNGFNSVNTTWLTMVDQGKLERSIESLRRLEPRYLLSGHLPACPGRVDLLLAALSSLPGIPPLPWPDQEGFLALLGRPKPRLIISTPQRSWELDLAQETLTIGRSPENAVVLDDTGVSRLHARIEWDAGQFVIQDLGSRNGLWLGGTRIRERVLQDGDAIRIGSAQLVFRRTPGSQDTTVVDALIDATQSMPPSGT
jgi:hypothetical protein